jgi:hypothetical protein
VGNGLGQIWIGIFVDSAGALAHLLFYMTFHRPVSGVFKYGIYLSLRVRRVWAGVEVRIYWFFNSM